MSSQPARIPIESLLAHESFVSALARRLVADDAEAEDLTQDVWLATLSANAGRISDPRSWLRAVLENRWRNRAREALARARRERLVARVEAQDPEPAERGLELRRKVLEAVGSLPEPYLTTIYLRYYEGLTFAALGERMQVPAETARSRIQRGIELLRARLDRELGPRASWIVALGALRGPGPGPGLESLARPAAGPGLGPGSHGLGIGSAVATSAIALLLVGTLLLWPQDPPDPQRIAAPPGSSPGDPRTARVELPPGGGARSEAEPRATSASETAGADGAAGAAAPGPDGASLGNQEPLAGHVRVSHRIFGRVLGPEGRPALGAQVYFYRWIPTDEEGRFEAELEIDDFGGSMAALSPLQPMIAHRAGNLPAVIPDVSTLLTGDPALPPWIELMLGGPPLAITGRVERADGSPALGWRVCLRNPGAGYPSGQRRIPLESITSGKPPIQEVDAEGRFRLEGLADRPYDVIAADPESLLHAVALAIVPSGSELVLRAPDPSTTRAVAGRVLSRSGTPVAGAEVHAALTLFHETLPGLRPQRAWGRAARTDAQGRFEFELGLQEPLPLFVLDPSQLVREVMFESLLEEGDWDQLELVVPLRCEVVLESHAARPPADFLAFLDAQERRLFIEVHEEAREDMGGMPFWRALPLGAGPGTWTVFTNEDARTALLYDSDGTEIERRPIQPSPQHPTRIAW